MSGVERSGSYLVCPNAVDHFGFTFGQGIERVRDHPALVTLIDVATALTRPESDWNEFMRRLNIAKPIRTIWDNPFLFDDE